MQNFRTLDLAIELYQACSKLRMPAHLKNQLLRSSSSIALNLSEGRGKPTTKDQLRFFHIAQGSMQETKTALILANHQTHPTFKLAEKTAAHLYKLIQNAH